jgi:hypothetical protein
VERVRERERERGKSNSDLVQGSHDVESRDARGEAETTAEVLQPLSGELLMSWGSGSSGGRFHASPPANLTRAASTAAALLIPRPFFGPPVASSGPPPGYGLEPRWPPALGPAAKAGGTPSVGFARLCSSAAGFGAKGQGRGWGTTRGRGRDTLDGILSIR